ncbi:hypothetical protein MVEN_02237100 [Mycena venus]|uniref:Uncharacterized protein n=1 Tax=Mycena venus TaxID=2733690 RepID=A0A8H6X825_9AGAR|nr:hypothetical protein MVEN_02237100 [Mycena venus]
MAANFTLADLHWSQLFDCNAALPLPASAVHKLQNMSQDDIAMVAHSANEVLQEETYRVLVKAAGNIPSAIMTQWCQHLVEHKSNLNQVATALGLPAIITRRTGKDSVGILLVVLIGSRQPDEFDSARRWLEVLISPAVSMARAQNAPRLAALAGRANRLPDGMSRTLCSSGSCDRL